MRITYDDCRVLAVLDTHGESGGLRLTTISRLLPDLDDWDVKNALRRLRRLKLGGYSGAFNGYVASDLWEGDPGFELKRDMLEAANKFNEEQSNG